MDHVFATDNRIIGNVTLVAGEHWPADDPIVLAYPQFFTADARFGLRSTRPLGADGYPVDLEDTSATPGTRRRRTRPAAKKAAAPKKSKGEKPKVKPKDEKPKASAGGDEGALQL